MTWKPRCDLAESHGRSSLPFDGAFDKVWLGMVCCALTARGLILPVMQPHEKQTPIID
jgi:hypothetical protein